MDHCFAAIPLPSACEGATNFVLIGEAGGGKSEIAINLACSLARRGDRSVHLFDLDMTKPLFRSRDQAAFLAQEGICFHYEEQFYDAPTVGGGVNRLMRDAGCYTVLDVGGDYIGARSVGGYAPLLNAPGTVVWYVINPYRPWSMDLEHIDRVLGQVLGVSHVQLDRLRILGNPNLGLETSAEDAAEGAKKLAQMIGPYKDIDFFAVRRELAGQVRELVPGPVYMAYDNITAPHGRACAVATGIKRTNTSIVSDQIDRSDVTVVKAPVTELALEMGNAKVLNVIMLGVYVGFTQVIEPAIVWDTIEHKLASKPKLLPLNRQAFEKGLEIGKAQRA